jgi:hypothetical protein
MQTQPHYELPPTFTPELLRRASLKEMLLLADRFGLEALAERIGYSEFCEYLREKAAK